MWEAADKQGEKYLVCKTYWDARMCGEIIDSIEVKNRNCF